MNTKPTLEKISPNFGSSILVKKHTEFLKEIKAFWHFHPEIELVYVNKGKGKTHIGNHLSYFNNSQLLLIGANLPHNGFTDRLTTNGSETLVQFKPEFLGGIDPIEEMKKAAAAFSKMNKTDEKVLENQIRYQKAFIQYQTSLVEMTESIMEITKALNPIK